MNTETSSYELGEVDCQQLILNKQNYDGQENIDFTLTLKNSRVKCYQVVTDGSSVMSSETQAPVFLKLCTECGLYLHDLGWLLELPPSHPN